MNVLRAVISVFMLTMNILKTRTKGISMVLFVVARLGASSIMTKSISKYHSIAVGAMTFTVSNSMQKT